MKKMDIEISKGVTVEDYYLFLEQENKNAIADMIYMRFYERYIKPFEFPDAEYRDKYKNGFSMMANSCLLIESYMAFKKGLKSTKNKCENLFDEFFNEEIEFKIFKNHNLSNKFYKNIRCGILHEGETRYGWTITRNRNFDLFTPSSRKINAYKFLKALDKTLKNYRDLLKNSDWEAELWKNARMKMTTVTRNAKLQE